MRSSARALALAALAALLGLAAAAAGPPRAAAQGTAGSAGGEPYHLSADVLEGSTTTAENVLKAKRVTVTHGATRVMGDSAEIYQTREFVVFRGNVKVYDGTTVMTGDEASYDRKARRADLRGNVRIVDGGAVITGREAVFYRAENRSVITGEPVLRDSLRTLRAKRIEYDRTRDVVLALGDVDAEDQAESTRVEAQRIRYDRGADYAWADGEPRLTLRESGGRATVVRADTLRFDNARDQVFAIGQVRIDRDSLSATSGRAAFYRAEDRALLLESPRAVSREGTARGDSMEVRFRGGRVSSLRMWPNAEVEYTEQVLEGRGERNVATGDEITLFMADDTAREAFIVGAAKSLYWPSSADSALGGRNNASGDTIRVAFEDGRPRRATVMGRSEGLYYMAAEGDTAAAARRERIVYRGSRIEYDVPGRTVDVLGGADVVYKEMHLTAGRVHFDARTERMRAEDEPVLQDGRDRIVGSTMTYDLAIRRGTVYSGRTTYDRGFFAGREVRRVSENVFNVRDGSYTTCEFEEPHYHFGSSKMKLVLREKVVAKPVVFYIKKIPVLALPFYVFPIKSGRHSGFQLPQVEFGSSSAGGKFIRNLGYYWAINDYLDATAWGDYYQDARWIAHGMARYHKRYLYQGQVSGSYQRTVGGSGFQQSAWDLQGNHFQSLAPGLTVRGLANLTNSSSYYRDADLGRPVSVRVQRNLRSSFALDRTWTSASLNVGLLRNQDLDPDPRGLRVEQQLPSASFRLSARPLGHLARGREPAHLPWLAQTLFAVSSSVVSQRNIFVNDFDPDSVAAGVASVADSARDIRAAARHDLSLTDTRNLSFLRFATGMSYSEVFMTRDQAGNRNQRAGVWGGRVGVNTQIFGTFRHPVGPLRALRHVVTPSVSFAYQPSYPRLRFVKEDGTSAARFDGVRGIAPLGASEQRALQFSLRNDIHLKWGDAEQPKVINSFIQMNTSGSYNFLADRIGQKPLSDLFTSLRLSPGARNDFSFAFVHNPYDRRLLSFTASTGMSFSGRSGVAPEDGGDAGFGGYGAGSAVGSAAPSTPAGGFGGAPDALRPGAAAEGLPWNLTLSLAYSGARSRKTEGGYNPWGSTARANGFAGLNLSRNWRLEYAAQADLLARDALPSGGFGARHVKLVSQNFSVTRDLHCWQMQFTRSISGETKEYYFKISVKNLPEVYYEQGSRGLRGFGGMQELY
ncbi:MAG TPA: putative LPS assembly protein LptD [Candidatus Eisenbacteria bacterium]|nr:putative LPS assembly protein LptD [Candidatus Eisenbacteria bacterium]